MLKIKPQKSFTSFIFTFCDKMLLLPSSKILMHYYNSLMTNAQEMKQILFLRNPKPVQKVGRKIPALDTL